MMLNLIACVSVYRVHCRVEQHCVNPPGTVRAGKAAIIFDDVDHLIFFGYISILFIIIITLFNLWMD